MKRYGPPQIIVTDKLRSYGAAMKVIGNAPRQETGRWLNNRVENSHLPFRRRERPCFASDKCDVYRNLLQSILPFTTTSIRNDIFTHEAISSSTEAPLSLSGASFVPPKFRHLAAN